MRPFFRAAGCLAILLPLLCAPPLTTASDRTAGTALVDVDPVRVHIPTSRGAVWLNVEVADTPGTHTRGLMGRDHLSPDAGMLFLYGRPQEPDRGFWMYRTRFALDIAFLDADGRILVILAMEPCPSRLPWRCPGYRPGTAYSAALEVNRGFFARHGVGVGDQVMLPAGLARR